MIIAIGGLHGTGKSTCAKALAKKFNLKYVSAGEMFRKIAYEKGVSIEELSRLSEVDKSIDLAIDEEVKKTAEEGDVVLEGQLTPWFIKNKALKIYVAASKKERILRISKRDCLTLEEAEKETLNREASERKRYKEYYGINIEDLSIYDLIIDTGLFSKDETIKILEKIVKFAKSYFKGDN
ncbi:AAA family ATPase [Candidatus Bathyarchaeota archaeon]|nr:AAA family ATPase [Candidatus Bathyarchaeota archaeon]